MMTWRELTAVMALCCATLAASGCADQFEIIDEPSASDAVPPAVQDAFDRSCAYGGCHDAGTAAGALSLTAQDAPSIIDAPSLQSELPLVELGSVEGSYLAIKMFASGALPPDTSRVGARMPPDPSDEELVDVALIMGWIAGAELPTSNPE